MLALASAPILKFGRRCPAETDLAVADRAAAVRSSRLLDCGEISSDLPALFQRKVSDARTMGGVRILISTWPAHGHLLPLLPIARAAERAGHDVVVASGVEGTVEAGRRGLRTWEVGPSRAEANAGSALRSVTCPPSRRSAA